MSPDTREDMVVIDLDGNRSALIAAAPRGDGGVTLRIGERKPTNGVKGGPGMSAPIPDSGADDDKPEVPRSRIVGGMIEIPTDAVERLASALLLLHRRRNDPETRR